MLNFYDISCLIPDYPDDDENIPPCPDEQIPEEEKERLFEEICTMLASGALDPDRELP